MQRALLVLVLAVSALAQDNGTEWGRVRAYLAGGLLFSRDDAGFSKQTPYLSFNLDKNWRAGRVLLINSFFETRLTSIPVATNSSGLLASRKAAEMSGGVYAPILTTRWTYNQQGQALFVAPLLRAGFQTPSTDQASHFYTASGAGVRLGHFRMSGNKESAPELISYVDLLYGHFTSIPDPRRRLAVEGALKAPGTPLVVGFAANIGHSGAWRDDLRFFIGTRFDLGSLIARLKAVP